jgi:hypothetical protein
LLGRPAVDQVAEPSDARLGDLSSVLSYPSQLDAQLRDAAAQTRAAAVLAAADGIRQRMSRSPAGFAPAEL